MAWGVLAQLFQDRLEAVEVMLLQKPIVSGRYTGRRVGWIVRRHLDVLVEPGHDAAYIPVRPAHG